MSVTLSPSYCVVLSNVTITYEIGGRSAKDEGTEGEGSHVFEQG